jgi:hypothetical protein
LDVVEFVPPSTWTTRTVAARMPFEVVGRVTPEVDGVVRLTMRIELHPTGIMALLAPVLRPMMQRTAKANLVRIKAAVSG